MNRFKIVIDILRSKEEVRGEKDGIA